MSALFVFQTVFGVKPDPGLKLKEEDVTRVLTDVKQMKGKQETLSAKMDKMKKYAISLDNYLLELMTKDIFNFYSFVYEALVVQIFDLFLKDNFDNYQCHRSFDP